MNIWNGNKGFSYNNNDGIHKHVKSYPSCESDLLMLPASFRRYPAAPVNFCRSDPAKSTRLILLVLNLLLRSSILCKLKMWGYINCSSILTYAMMQRNVFWTVVFANKTWEKQMFRNSTLFLRTLSTPSVPNYMSF